MYVKFAYVQYATNVVNSHAQYRAQYSYFLLYIVNSRGTRFRMVFTDYVCIMHYVLCIRVLCVEKEAHIPSVNGTVKHGTKYIYGIKYGTRTTTVRDTSI